MCLLDAVDVSHTHDFFLDAQQDAYGKLLAFIDTTDHYHTDRLYGLLPSEGRVDVVDTILYAR